MSLTMGTGPFGHASAGSFNFDTPDKGAILLDVIPRRVRGRKDGETVVDSKRVHMLHESRILPLWYFPEDEPVIGHPRDPFHRIDVNRSSRHVKVALDGETLAESDRPVALFETGLPTRWYLPREDLNMDLLTPSETRTTCAYKGHASTFSSGTHDDIAWTYPEPEREVEPIRDRITFYNEFVDIELDGERQERPATPFSR